MPYHSIPVHFQGKYYILISWLGLLLEKNRQQKVKVLSQKKKQLDYVNNPFTLTPADLNVEKREYHTLIVLYAKILVWFCEYFYPFAYLISHLRLNIFRDGTEANIVFRRIIKNKPQKTLCLPRAIFIATTSSRFKECGAMFIGVFLPTRRMHAWVIEDGRHTDYFDNEWTCYSPVCIMT